MLQVIGCKRGSVGRDRTIQTKYKYMQENREGAKGDLVE
jgi:hypothetical protein